MNGCNFYCQPVNNNNTHPNPYINSISTYNDYTRNVVIAKGDSAATNNYWRQEDSNVLSEIKHYKGPSVTIPDGSQISSNKQGQLPLSPLLSENAKNASIMPELKSSSLISLGKLADDNCKILLDKKFLHAVKENEIVLSGIRNQNDGLWDIPVFKKDISPPNYILPTIHPSIYSSRNSSSNYKSTHFKNNVSHE